MAPVVTTVVGTGVGGYADTQIDNPFGLVIGPDDALYFCDLGNQRIRRLDLATRPHADDGSPARPGNSFSTPDKSFPCRGPEISRDAWIPSNSLTTLPWRGSC